VAASDPDAATTITYSLVGGADQTRFTINAATGVLTFISAPDFDTPGDVGGDNIYDVVVRASDGTLIDDQAIAVTLMNVNEAPVITFDGGSTLANVNMAENTAVVGTILASDPDAGASLAYSIVGGPDQLLFTINSTTGALSFVAPPNFETPADSNFDNIYGVDVQVSDGLGGVDVQTIFVTVTDTNETPTISSNGGLATASVSVAENDTAVTTVVASDPDAATTITYSLVGGADQLKFTINSTTGVLTFITAPGFDTPDDFDGNNIYDVVVRASDGTLFDDQAIAVTLMNVNEAPTDATLSANTVAENAANGTVVGSVTGIDPDAGATFTYAFVAGQDAGGRFTISAGGQITVANGSLLDFESATSHSVTVRVMDQGGLTFDKVLTISVQNASGNFAGTAGVDSYSGTNEEDVINGLAGNDVLSGGLGNDIINGGDDADILYGEAGNDVIDGGTADDQLIGGAGADTLTGSAGDDYIRYDTDTTGVNINLNTSTATGVVGSEANGDMISGFEHVFGGAGGDTITGSSIDNIIFGQDGLDIIDGGDGNDFIFGGAGADTLTGGSGNDWLNYQDGSVGVVVNLDTNAASGGFAQGDVISGFESLLGSAGTDALTGTTGANELRGFYGSDTISGLDGNDTIYGDSLASHVADGNDIIDAGAGNDVVDGGGGNDTITGGLGNDIIDGGSGIDTVIFSGKRTDYNVTVSGLVYTITDIRGAGYDGVDTIQRFGSFQFSDGLILEANLIDIIGTAGNDAALNGTGDANVIRGLGGDDTLSGGGGNDYLDGGADNNVDEGDRLIGGVGADTLDGGAGNYDVAVYTGDTVAISVDLNLGTGTGGNAQGDVLMNIEAVYSGNGNDTLIGSIRDEVFSGDAGDDSITGGDGIDWLIGGAGADTLDGGGGSLDTAGYQFATAAIAIDMTQTVQTGPGEATGDRLIGIERIFATAYNDTLTGDGQANFLFGSAGNDSIVGGGGNDTLTGEGDPSGLTTGNDTITGGAGNDSIDGGNGTDTVILTGKRADYNITLSGSTYTITDGRGAGFDGVDTVVGVENFQFSDGVIAFGEVVDIEGTAGNDAALNGTGVANVIYGNGGNDAINGGAGDDWINGGPDSDTIAGGLGADTMLGGGTFDILDYRGESADVTINTALGTATGGSATGDQFSGFHMIWLGSGNNTIYASGGAAYIHAGSGNDTFYITSHINFYGGGGADTFIGWAGLENIRYNNSSTSVTVNLLTGLGSGGDAQGDTYSNVEWIEGSGVGDIIIGNNVGNQLYGNFGSDTITGGTGADYLYGGYQFTNGGGDTGDLGDSLNAGDGNDTVYGAGGNDTVYGGAGNDVLFGGRVASQDVDTGNDTLNGGAGNDTIDGDAGTDTVEFSGALTNYTITQVGAVYTVVDNRSGSPDGTDTITNVENFQFTDGTVVAASMILGNAAGEALNGTTGSDVILGFGGNDNLNSSDGIDRLEGGDDNDYLNGGLGDDILNGGNGNDLIHDNSGADSINGGSGIDTVSFAGTGTAINVNLTTGIGTGGDANGDTYVGIENIIGGNAGDTITGDTQNNAIWGDQGNDTLRGENGNDTLEGAQGADTLDGGFGSDWLGYNNSDAAVNVNISTNVVSGGHATGDVVNDFECVEGSTYNDTITGTSGINEIRGHGGADSIVGNGGQDSLHGGDGDDRLDGSGSAIVSLFGGTGDDRFFLDALSLQSAGTSIMGEPGSDRLVLDGATATLSIADVTSKVSGVERVDLDQTNIYANFSNATAADIRSILGISSGTGTLELDFSSDGSDNLSIGVGQFARNAANTNLSAGATFTGPETLTFYNDATYTTEIAKVQIT
ncbi:MAG: cadherin domain-containing protein, partial [Beijerinckiaceae bacterium]